MKIIIFLFILLTSISVFASDEEKVPLVGLDRDGSPVEVFVHKKSLQEKLKKSIDSVQETSLHFLESKRAQRGWSLRTVVVGLSADIQVGIAGILTLDLIPRFRVLFSNDQDAAIP